MPPPESGKRLTKQQIDLLVKWVGDGAPYQAYWAYVPPKKHATPKLDSSWSDDPIDNFIVDSLNTRKIAPSPDAGLRTLIRRV
ncbi:unnamed protein product, partial [marine sediment metagenome]